MLVGMQICIVNLEISMAVSQKIRNKSTSRPRNTTLGYIPKGYTVIPQGHLLNYIHSSIIHNSENLKTTYMLFNQRMDKENMVHLHNGVLFSEKKKPTVTS